MHHRHAFAVEQIGGHRFVISTLPSGVVLPSGPKHWMGREAPSTSDAQAGRLVQRIETTRSHRLTKAALRTARVTQVAVQNF
jgi:hypothetical protein